MYQLGNEHSMLSVLAIDHPVHLHLSVHPMILLPPLLSFLSLHQQEQLHSLHFTHLLITDLNLPEFSLPRFCLLH